MLNHWWLHGPVLPGVRYADSRMQFTVRPEISATLDHRPENENRLLNKAFSLRPEQSLVSHEWIHGDTGESVLLYLHHTQCSIPNNPFACLRSLPAKPFPAVSYSFCHYSLSCRFSNWYDAVK